MKCKYCLNNIHPFIFYNHFYRCKQHRKHVIENKINRCLTVPTESLLSLTKENLSDLNEALSQSKSYLNVLKCCDEKLTMEEAIAINNLFWYAYTPFYSHRVSGWYSLFHIEETAGKIYGFCKDWRTGPPDTFIVTLDMVPAEILEEALELIGITHQSKSLEVGLPYQHYIDKKFSTCK